MKKKDNGIPILSAREIDEQAEALVRRLTPGLFTGVPDATDLKKLFESLGGWHYAGRYLSRDGCLLGLASFEGGTIALTDQARRTHIFETLPAQTILVDRALYEPEREAVFRFTFAHECGHALYHREFCSRPENMRAYGEQGESRFIRDTEEAFSVREDHRLQNERDWLEWQANVFASAALMPRSLVLRVAEMAGRGEENQLAYLNQLNAVMTDVFRVSATAAFYRMKELGIAPQDSGMIRGGMIVISHSPR